MTPVIDPHFEKGAIGQGPVLLVSNYAEGDDDFTGLFGPHGWLSWNVTRMWRDAQAGQHGQVWGESVKTMLPNVAEVEVDRAKVERLRPVVKAGKANVLMMLMLDGVAWMVDGHHRLHAMAAEGIPQFGFYLLNDAVPFDPLKSPYRIIKRRFPDTAALEAFKRAAKASQKAGKR